MASIEIIIVAAGSGLRYGAPLPKQFCLLDGRPVVMHTVDTFRRLLPGAHITLVINRDMETMWNDLCLQHCFTSPDIVFGGATRWESVRNAVMSQPEDDGVTMIHDAVRPVIDRNMLDRLLDAMQSDIDGAIPAIEVTDSLRELEPDGNSRSIDRSRFRAVQTPQAFRTYRLRQAYSLPYLPVFTDDASVMEAAGFDKIVLTDGSARNIKITRSGDIAIASIYINGSDR